MASTKFSTILPLPNATPEFDFDFSKISYPGDLSKPPALEVAFKVSFTVLIIVCSLLGNSIVVAVIIREVRLHRPTFFYIANLAVSDLFVTLSCTWVYLVDDLTHSWVLGQLFDTFAAGHKYTWRSTSSYNFLCKFCLFYCLLASLKPTQNFESIGIQDFDLKLSVWWSRFCKSEYSQRFQRSMFCIPKRASQWTD